MKLKALKSNENSTSFFDNQVDKSLSSKKLKLSHSSRRKPNRGHRKAQGKSKRETSNAVSSFNLGTENFLKDLPELMRPEFAASILGVSPKTIYDWRYRSKQRNIPSGLFVKLNRSLLIRTSILKEWIASQNPSLQCERN